MDAAHIGGNNLAIEVRHLSVHFAEQTALRKLTRAHSVPGAAEAGRTTTRASPCIVSISACERTGARFAQVGFLLSQVHG